VLAASLYGFFEAVGNAFHILPSSFIMPFGSARVGGDVKEGGEREREEAGVGERKSDGGGMKEGRAFKIDRERGAREREIEQDREGER
jgi:hypothetical protein